MTNATDSGILFGLAAALCWGTADYCARGAARTGGIYRTLLYIQIVAVIALLAVGLPTGLLHLANLPAGLVVLTGAIQLVILLGAALLYRAFAVGTLALVSPIAASYAALTALLSLLSGEHPSAPQLVGIALTLCGVVLASTVSSPPKPTDFSSSRESSGGGRLAPGLVEALTALVFFGVAYWALRFVVGPVGGYTAAFIGKVSDLVALVLVGTVAIVFLTRKTPTRGRDVQLMGRPEPRFLLWVVPNAVLDTAANVAYNLGITTSLTSIVSVISSLFGAVTVLLAWIFLHERLSGWQWLGVAAIFAGVALVSV